MVVYFKNLTDSFVVIDDNDYHVGYWIGVLNINKHEETLDIWCLAIDVCTHRDYRKAGIMDLIIYLQHNIIKEYMHLLRKIMCNKGIMTKWGFKKGWYSEEHDMHYWTYEREDDA